MFNKGAGVSFAEVVAGWSLRPEPIFVQDRFVRHLVERLALHFSEVKPHCWIWSLLQKTLACIQSGYNCCLRVDLNPWVYPVTWLAPTRKNTFHKNDLMIRRMNGSRLPSLPQKKGGYRQWMKLYGLPCPLFLVPCWKLGTSSSSAKLENQKPPTVWLLNFGLLSWLNSCSDCSSQGFPF